jgi:phasin family protein
MVNQQEQFSALTKANLETTLNLASAVLAGAERLANLQLTAAKELLADNAKTARALLTVKDPKELMALQPAVEPMVERALSYSRNVYEVASQTQAEIAKVMESRLKELTGAMNEAMEKVAKTGPGSDVAMAAVKSAMAAAGSAYDNIQKMTKQVTQISEANLTAAAHATKGAGKKSGKA